MTVAYALAHSINTVAVQISELVGRDKVIAMAHRLGITSQMENIPSIALGSLEVNLLEMTQAYAHLADGGTQVQAYGIESVTASTGELLYKHEPPQNPEQVLRPNVVAMMNSLLSGVIEYGTGRGANIGRPAAGKTGTTSDYRDAWFIGYTPDLVTGVWIGNDNNSPMRKETGGALPAVIWRSFMSQALKGVPPHDLPVTYQVEEQNGSELPWKIAPQQQPGYAPDGTPLAPGQQPGLPPGVEPPIRQPFNNPDATYQPAVPGQPAYAPAQPQPQPREMPRENGMTAPGSEPGQEEEIQNGGGAEQPAPQPDQEKLPQSFWDKLMGGDGNGQ
jgi:penicillin-binding protein 1A